MFTCEGRICSSFLYCYFFIEQLIKIILNINNRGINIAHAPQLKATHIAKDLSDVKRLRAKPIFKESCCL